MAIFSQRKVQRLKQMLMQKAADSELDEVCDFLNQRPKKTQANCGLLKLPAELRNIIYEYVAEDAHAACQKPVDPDLLQGERWREAVLLCGRARQSRDFSGEKVCPGLLGVCHELFREFHSVFYSPRFIDARYHEAGTGWKHIKNPALLDAVVNQKHPVTVFDTIRVQFGIEDVLRQKQQIETSSFTSLLPDRRGRTFLLPRPGEVQEPAAPDLERSCKDFRGNNFWFPGKKDMCSLCVRPSEAVEKDSWDSDSDQWTTLMIR